MAQKSFPALTNKRYREFAFLTLAITMTVAIFADGERREAISDEVEAQERRAAAARAQQQQKPTLIVRDNVGRQAGSGWAADTGNAFGLPMDNAVANEAWGVRASAIDAAAEELSYVPPGISPERWAEMTEEERAEYLRSIGKRPGPTQGERSMAIDSIGAASAARARGD